ncbi:diacylglycerol/lipid kinase family protein [Daejeonella oryzae]|uniref:diacylglycerol/lipid kinase family protein n=1 Tax=Daejeonella oryzae TaxID=1122943 RepID=UPI0004235E5C|nr:diacylglycerol kinase family protein [Daejeonella oryzae]
MKVFFVINPGSGTETNKILDPLIEEISQKLHFDYEVYSIEGSDADSVIKKKIEEFKPDIVAAAGGDGTVNMLACILAYTDITLLIIPTGSANGMARELQIANNPEQAIHLLETGITKPIDLIKINGKICIHLGDVGLNARIVKRFEQEKKRGMMSYARHLMAEIFLLKHYKFRIKYENKEITRRAVSLTFANATKYGTGAVINPNGIIDDGKFELVIIKPFPDIKILSIAWKMFRNTLLTSDYVEIISCNEAHIKSSRKTTLQIDGEIINRVKEIKVEMMHNALKVLVPAQT